MAVLIALVFFFIGFCWYYGQTTLRRYLHTNAQTTALAQLPRRLGIDSSDEPILEADNHTHSRESSLPVQHQQASSDDDDDDEKTDPRSNILPPIDNGNNESTGHQISFVNANDEHEFHISSTNHISCTVTPGLGVFLTTSSRHTPHVFERVLARMHAVSLSINLFSS